MVQAHVATARLMVIATPDPLGVRQMMAHARSLNPGITILVRAHNDTEAQRLVQDSAGQQVAVFVGESELAQAMLQRVLDTVAVPSAASSTSLH